MWKDTDAGSVTRRAKEEEGGRQDQGGEDRREHLAEGSVGMMEWIDPAKFSSVCGGAPA